MSNAELKIPPDVVWLLVAALMWVIAQVSTALAVGFALRIAVSAVFVTAGAIAIIAARIALDRAETTWHPSDPSRSTALVTSGAFRYSRNPTYVGMQLVLLGWASYLVSPGAALASVLFGVYIDRFQIRPEERALEMAFGQAYREYAHRVRRWV